MRERIRGHVGGSGFGTISTARVQDYLLSGDDHFSFDRAYADDCPPAAALARRISLLDRTFLFSAVSFLLDRGIRQFLDLGSGLATMGGVQNVAAFLRKDVRVVHVDNDPAAVELGRLRGEISGHSNAFFLHADAVHAELVLCTSVLEGWLDLREPIGVLAIGLLHLLGPRQAPELVVPRYCAAFVRGSAAAISHLTPTFTTSYVDKVTRLIAGPSGTLHPREEREIVRMFGDLTIVKPGLTALPQRVWTPGGPQRTASVPNAGLLAALAIKE